jgi:uncharacterized membrane protein
MATLENRSRTTNWLVLLIAAVVIIVPVSMVVAMAFADNGQDNYDYGMMGSWGGAWGLMMIVPIAAVILVVIVLLIALTDRPTVVTYPAAYSPPCPPPPAWSGDAKTVLDRRLAAGEVTIEEYNRIRNELTKH